MYYLLNAFGSNKLRYNEAYIIMGSKVRRNSNNERGKRENKKI